MSAPRLVASSIILIMQVMMNPDEAVELLIWGSISSGDDRSLELPHVAPGLSPGSQPHPLARCPMRSRPILAAALLMTFAQPAAAQRAAIQPDSARAQIRTVLRAFYFNLESQNWDA